MKKEKSLSLFLLGMAIILGCNPAYTQSYAEHEKEWKKAAAVENPIINNAVWENITKEKVYNNCLAALHLEDFGLEPQLTSKESGLIVTSLIKFYPDPQYKLVGGEYYLNILVYESEGNDITIDIQVKGARWYKIDDGAWGWKKSDMDNSVNNKISDDVGRFINKLESMQGKAISKTTMTLNFE